MSQLRPKREFQSFSNSSSEGNRPYRDPPRPFSELLEEGALRRRWLEDPDEPNCPVKRSRLTYPGLSAYYPEIVDSEASDQIHRVLAKIEETPNAIPSDLRVLLANAPLGSCRNVMLSKYETIGLGWDGLIGPGVLFITLLGRKRNSGSPYASEICQANYQHHQPLKFLRHIFVLSVINEQTLFLIREDLYGGGIGSGPWPTLWPQGSNLKDWHCGTPQFDALMGTRIGKMIAYLLLGAFPRGSRRIRKVATWPSLSSVNLRFDLEVLVPSKNV